MLTHLDSQGRVRMVDVSSKAPTARVAVAEGMISMNEGAFAAIIKGNAPKGDVLSCARIAAIQASKRTSELIPLCHPLYLSKVEVSLVADEINHSFTLSCTTATVGPTGVEMEALTAVSVGLLTIYDMAKAMDRGMHITNIHLVCKDGGKSGEFHA
ncbi:MAG: cyclic pyranopterin monophosphate synthase MoaC [Sphaerochaetaceae bacterium]